MNVRNLEAIFNQFDVNRNGKLDLLEFENGLNKFGFFLKKTDYQCLLRFYDVDHDGHINFPEFLSGIKEPLSERRLSIVLKAFNSVDVGQTGSAKLAAIGEKIVVDNDAEYKSGAKTRESIVNGFLK